MPKEDKFNILLDEVIALSKEHDSLTAAMPKLRLNKKRLEGSILLLDKQVFELNRQCEQTTTEIEEKRAEFDGYVKAANESIDNQKEELESEAYRERVELQTARAEISQRTAQLDKDELRLSEATARLNKLQLANSTMADELQALDTSLNERSAYLDHREKELTKHGIVLGKKTQQLANREIWVTDQETRLEARSADLIKAAEVAQQKADNAIANAKKQGEYIAMRESEVERRERLIAGKEKDITAKLAKLADRQQKLKSDIGL